MAIKRVTSPAAPEPPPERWSNCLLVDGIAYVSGMVARGDDVRALAGMDEYEQAKVIFGKIKALIEAAGGTMADVVKVIIYVTNIKNNTKVWAARREFFTGNLLLTLIELTSLVLLLPVLASLSIELTAIVIVFAAIAAYFKSKGGYKPVKLEQAPAA